MKNSFILDSSISIEDVIHVARNSQNIKLSESVVSKMKASRNYVDKIIQGNKLIYGINTGFGALSNKIIDRKELKQLQLNLVRSHCTGVGKNFSEEIVRAILFLRAVCLSKGHSGISPEAVFLMQDFLNHNIVPSIPCQGSVGASGDLAPLAHMALTLIGEGTVTYNGKLVNSSFAIHEIGKTPVSLAAKDGLALINGTSVLTALGCLATHDASNLFKFADIVSMMTLEGVKGSIRAFDPKITSLKPHLGQISVIENLFKILPSSEILNSHEDCLKVQDPYSLRCIPQVHGAARQTLIHAMNVINTEINSVTDNPLIFPDDDLVLSGGNFHGQHVSMCMDYLSMGISELSAISERRIEKMMNPIFSELPAFLTKNPGLNSGLMIAHVTSAALASENKTLCFPASVDSIPTSTDKEDHVSMGVTAGSKLLRIVENTRNVLATEALCAFQALHFRRPLKSSPAIEAAFAFLSKYIQPIEDDRVFSKDILTISDLIKDGSIIKVVEEVTGELK